MQVNNEFIESEHPRDEQGRFKEKGIRITGKEFGEYSGDKIAYEKAFFEYYRYNLAGKSVNNPILGKINFYQRQANETINKNNKTVENLKYIAAVPEILESSRDVTEESVTHPKKDVLRI